MEEIGEESRQSIADMGARLEAALRGEDVANTPPFFGKAVEILRGLAGKGEGQDRCLFLFSFQLAAVEWLGTAIIEQFPDKAALVNSEQLDEAAVEETGEGIVSHMGTCNPFCKEEVCITRDLANVFVEAGWDAELLRFCATLKAKVTALCDLIGSRPGQGPASHRKPVIVIAAVRRDAEEE